MNKAKLTFASLILVSLLPLSACNTVKGIGRDLESMVESIQRAGD